MNKIAVILNGNRENVYFWVDSVTMHDEYDYVCAVLICPKNGTVFCRDISTIKVISNDYLD